MWYFWQISAIWSVGMGMRDRVVDSIMAVLRLEVKIARLGWMSAQERTILGCYIFRFLVLLWLVFSYFCFCRCAS
jgi:hypothetical protein